MSKKKGKDTGPKRKLFGYSDPEKMFVKKEFFDYSQIKRLGAQDYLEGNIKIKSKIKTGEEFICLFQEFILIFPGLTTAEMRAYKKEYGKIFVPGPKVRPIGCFRLDCVQTGSVTMVPDKSPKKPVTKVTFLENGNTVMLELNDKDEQVLWFDAISKRVDDLARMNTLLNTSFSEHDPKSLGHAIHHAIPEYAPWTQSPATPEELGTWLSVLKKTQEGIAKYRPICLAFLLFCQFIPQRSYYLWLYTRKEDAEKLSPPDPCIESEMSKVDEMVKEWVELVKDDPAEKKKPSSIKASKQHLADAEVKLLWAKGINKYYTDVQGTSPPTDYAATWSAEVTSSKAHVAKVEKDEKKRKQDIEDAKNAPPPEEVFDPEADPFADFELSKIVKTKFEPRPEYDE
eukprot:TRINITY_DN1176_c0_g1_i1.p1 TRINITY_DN1176_c0_g1~~TRINITY_DN1176_c0_g1_i1.p1  ORF type:complete len:399 (+),score=106.77 TRINITY_DN1176_c0_g1_i1:69-1265(+)